MGVQKSAEAVVSGGQPRHMSGGLSAIGRRGAARRPAFAAAIRTSCSMNSTVSWSGEAIASCAMPMTRTFMSVVRVLANEVLASVERFLNHRLKLRLNRDKSRVAGRGNATTWGMG